jgi:hypothetical protein
MTVMPEALQLEMVGRAILLCNHIEELARHMAVLPLERRTALQLPDLLIGARGTKQAQQFLTVSATQIPEASGLIEAPIRWMKEAEAAIEKRNDLLHRPVGMRITATVGGVAATGKEQLRLRRARRTHEIEDLNEQYVELVGLLEDVWERGRAVRGDLADSLTDEARTR